MEKPNNIIEISTSIKDLFRYWFMFLEPLHNLTNRENGGNTHERETFVSG